MKGSCTKLKPVLKNVVAKVERSPVRFDGSLQLTKLVPTWCLTMPGIVSSPLCILFHSPHNTSLRLMLLLPHLLMRT